MSYHLKTHTETELITDRGAIISDNDDGPTPAKQPRLDIQPEKKSVRDMLQGAALLAINTMANIVKRPWAGASIPSPVDSEIELARKAFGGCLNVYEIQNIHNMKDPKLFLNRLKTIIIKKIEEHLKQSEVKIRLQMLADYKRGEEIEEFNFKTKYLPILKTADLSGYYDDAIGKILREMEEFQARGSGWSLHSIDSLELHICRYKPIRGSSYIPLPKQIRDKRAIINVRNHDTKCFLWSVLSALHPVDLHTDRVSKYKRYEHEFDDALKGIEFPVKLKDIPKFEKRSGVSINVYACELNKIIREHEQFEDYPQKKRKRRDDNKYSIYPLHITKHEKQGRHVNLLYLKDKNKNTHYCWIKDMSRLSSSQISDRNGKIYICDRCLMHFHEERLLKEHKETCQEPQRLLDDTIDSHICNRCMTEFNEESKLEKHKEYCNEHDPVKIRMPEVFKTKDGGEIPPKLYFKNQYRKMKVPYVGYADFECILKPIINEGGTDQITEENKPFTKKYQSHEAASFSLYITTASDEYDIPFDLYHEHLGPDTAKVFVNTLTNISKELFNIYGNEAAKPMQLTEADIQVIKNSVVCHICEKRFTKKDKPVSDHDHLTGKFRGVAHNSCNLNFKKPHFLPIFIHNLSNYDAHLFVKMLGFDKNNIAVLATTEERYISFEVKIEGGVNLRFLDSFRFMASSLDSLTKNLTKDKFKHTSKYFSPDKLDYVLRKGVFPYDYMNSMEKFDETSLPPRDAFYNKLNKSDIEDEDYEHACKVWTDFNIQNMAQYTLLYNKTDTLLLADIMENFRDVCMNTYSLDPAWYFTSPGLAWDAMLKKTQVSLELLTDPDMELLLSKGIRGGISQCCHRYTKANNPYLHDYDPEKPNEYLIYLDVNNLYGWAMSKYMPKRDFAWCSEEKLREIEHMMGKRDFISEKSKTGYIFEVDLEYPRELHDEHRDLPLAPENKCPPGSNQRKLLTTLWDKEKYVLHYQNLQLYISLGMRLKKIHRGIQFTQSAWLKEYIDLNTDMRTKATNDFEKDFYKLMNNSVFGKTMENIRKHVNIRLATHNKQVEKLVARPNFKSATIFSEQLAAVHMGKTSLYFNKPIYVGMTILDVSKIAVYDFHYNVMRPRYGDNSRVQYTDTDSLTYNVKTKDIYEDIKDMIEHFDTSDYKADNPYKMPLKNKKVIGKWKDELAGDVMREFVGLRSKMYAYDSEGHKSGKKAKGVKKSVVNRELKIDDYKVCLFDNKETYKTMNTIRSKRHDLYSVTQNKKALSPKDDKRYICEDGVETLPWGHYDIPMQDIIDNEIFAALDLD